DPDLDVFIEAQTRKDAPCPSTSTETAARRSGTSTSKCEVIGFTATKCTTRREAEKVVAAKREKAKRRVARLAAVKTSLRLDDVADRYWNEVGQHHAGADNTEHDLALLIEFFGKDKLLPEVTGDDVARLVAWRRGHRGSNGPRLISPHTVNH